MNRPDLSAMTAEEAARWSEGKTISELVEAMGVGPQGRLVVVSFVPKNGRANRCSVCKTLLTTANVIGYAMEVTLLGGDEINCSVLVCSETCERRLHARHSD